MQPMFTGILDSASSLGNRHTNGMGADAEQGFDDYADSDMEVSRSRPSVSACKTVNAVYPDGREEAVLAQHYAVPVTDVSHGLFGEVL
jgi:hypothetical protein